MIIKSNASWTKIPDSSDEHSSILAAHEVCNALLREYGKFPKFLDKIRGTCLKAWVTIEDDGIVWKVSQ